jgi:hypothetical protein
MSETRAPGFTASIPWNSASSVTRSSRTASGEIVPDRHRHGAVAEEPVQLRAHIYGDDVSFDERTR